MRPTVKTLSIVLAVAGCASAHAALNVTSVSPVSNTNVAPRSAPISVTFDQPVMTSTVTGASFRAFGRWTGPIAGTFSFSNADRTVTLTPTRPFSAGDQVIVNLSHDLRAADGSAIRTAGYVWVFHTKTAATGLNYVEVAEMSNHSPSNAQTRIYGGFCTDLNNDGWLDITTVNEVSEDLRVFMNAADGTGMYEPFLEPPCTIGVEASPNDSADFNNDGFADAVTANYSGGNLSLVLGNGDGTFQPQTLLPAGSVPAGVVAIDVDADGDTDLVNGNNGSNNLQVRLNNGAGVFAPPTSFDSGGNGEYGLAVADMNNDGILDVVVGCRDGQQVAVVLGNGDGTFTPTEVQGGVGAIWQVNAADLNGDGNADVATGNSFSATGSILFGDGTGQLGAPTNYPTAAHVVATDLGDLDGDGDLDWVLSHFSGGVWRVLINDGAGNFTFNQAFNASNSPSCSALLDIDNDGDLDMVLFDELADTIRIMRNTGPNATPDLNGDGVVGAPDLAQLLGSWGPCPAPPTGCPADLTSDGTVGAADLAQLLGSWGPV